MSTEERSAAPCSVKASGLPPPRLRREGITFCDSSISTSLPVHSKQEIRRKPFGIAAHLLSESDRPDLVQEGQISILQDLVPTN
jgi:hypothetical protein